MKYKSTEQVMKIIKNKEQIRNFGVIAHVDHGKTTMSDSLLANSGIIAPSAAGTALALDSMKQEQERGITIVRSTCISYSQIQFLQLLNLINSRFYFLKTQKIDYFWLLTKHKNQCRDLLNFINKTRIYDLYNIWIINWYYRNAYFKSKT